MRRIVSSLDSAAIPFTQPFPLFPSLLHTLLPFLRLFACHKECYVPQTTDRLSLRAHLQHSARDQRRVLIY